MTMNFNYKKIFKYFFIGFLCYLLFKSCSVGATGTFLDNDVNIITPNNTELADVLYKGNFDDLNSYFNQNFGITDFSTYVDNFKSKVATQMGYSTFDLLSNDYYFIIQYHYRVNYFNGTLVTNIFLYKKTDIDSSSFVPYLSVKTENNVSSLNSNTSYNVIIRPNSYQYSFSSDIRKTNFSNDFNLNNNAYNFNFTCSRNSSFCSTTFNSTTLTPSLNIAGFINNGEPVWYDTNNPDFDFKFGTHRFSTSASNVYFFQYLKINNSSNTYNIDDVIADIDLSIMEPPNVQNLGNNSFGINNNYINVSFIDSSVSPTIYNVIKCPADRNLINDICYIYNSDIENFNFSNTEYYNFARYFLGDNTNIPLREGYYYIITVRIYTPFNLKISNIRVSSGNLNSPVTINDVIVKDYFIYKDYQIVFTPNITGDLAINFLDIYFNNYSEFTDVLPNDISFGVFNFIKYSEFSTQPTTADINNNYNNNSLDTISTNQNSSFFKNFKVNDRGLSQIVLLPLNFIRSWTNATCSPISLPLPHLANAQLPCLSNTFSQYFGSFWTLYKVIINGFIIYRICINLLRIIKNIYDVENNEIEVIDL